MTKRIKVILVPLTLLGLTILLSGCWDRREINDFAFVLASAIDKEGDGVRVNILIPLPGNLGGATGGGGGGSGGKEPYIIQSESGHDIREAIAKLQNRLSRKIFLGHQRVLLVSESLARSGVEKIIDGVTRLPEHRLTVFIAVTKGKAIDVLNANTRLERFPAEAARELLQSDASVRVDLKDVIVQIISTGTDAYLPYVQTIETKIPSQDSDEIDIAGYALTHNGKMTNLAKGNDANGIRLLSGKFKPYEITLTDKEGKSMTFKIITATTRIVPIIVSGKPNYRVMIRSKASLEEVTNLQTDFENTDQRNEIERRIEKSMKDDITKTLKLIQKSNSDVVGFGQIANRKYPGKWRNNWKDKWDDIFPSCTFDVQVTANLYRIGMTKENLGERGY